MQKSVLTKKQTKEFKKTIVFDGKPSIIIAEVRHDDQCGNGHNTFTITGEIWYARDYERHLQGSHTADCQTCGMIHDQIAKHFPNLAPYLKWHGTHTDGPLYYIENTRYWVKEGNLDYARNAAVWPDASLEDLTEAKLKARLPSLMEAFQKDVESLGFIY